MSSSASSARNNGGGSSSPNGGSGSPTLGSGAPSKASKSSAWRAAAHIGSVPDDWPMYSAQASDYVLGPPIGFGASSVVYQASFLPLHGRACAVKVIDLEAFGRDLAELRRETQLMSLSKHPNVLRVRGCWVEGSKLHIATRLMSSGSMLDIMRFSFPEGFEESVIATVLKQALEGLNYLHINNWLHRDLKAANVLVDDDGTVLLGDFGVGVFLGEPTKPNAVTSEKKQDSISEGPRKSFVGTPCWMAPEVVERKGYGTKADIWSFGITALELSSGRAPHSRLAPVKVLMKTLKDEPPQLDRTGNAHKYSKLFDDFIQQCLQKDPAKRPSADKLLQHGFFKQAKSKKSLVSQILSGLPPLSERQDRRRAMSIASLGSVASWDFGMSSKFNTPSHERFDPFHNFSASFANPASPNGSVRSSRLISFDGHHTFIQVGEDGDGNKPAGDLPLRSPVPAYSQRRSRPNSMEMSNSTGSMGRLARHRRGSVSFDLGESEDASADPAKETDNHGLPVIMEKENKMDGDRAAEGRIPTASVASSNSPPNSSDVSTPTEGSDPMSKQTKLPPKGKELGGALSRLFIR